MTRLIAAWLALNVLAVLCLLIGGGRPEANAHPQRRHGGDYWY